MHKKNLKQDANKGPTGLQDEINRQFRSDVRRGVYLPGTRLPARAELQKLYQTTPVTIQRAFDKLKEDGFIRSEGQRGTFVADCPPCLANYAVVFPYHFKSQHPELNFWRVLALEAKRKSKSSDNSFTIYTDLNGHIDEPDYIKLSEDVKAERLAGIIFASSPHLLAKTPLFEDIMARTELPKVAFMGISRFPGIPVVSNSLEDSLCMVLNFFRNNGRHNLGVITAMSGIEGDGKINHEDLLISESEKRGIKLLPQHLQVMHSSLASRARALTQLLLKGAAAERPDALLIMDDSLVEAVSKGIVDCGLTNPDDLLVVGYSNFPEMPVSSVPISRYGFDVSVFLETCLNIMAKQHKGEAVPPKTLIPAEFKAQETSRILTEQKTYSIT